MTGGKAFTKENIRNSKDEDLNPHILQDQPKQKKDLPKIPKGDCDQVVWMHWNLLYWCNEKSLELKKEYRFDKNGRRFKFDFAIPALKIGIEYEGLNSEKSGHTTA